MRRIRALWNRSQSPKTKYYEVYRSEKLNIDEKRLKDLLVARVTQIPTINPVSVVDEPVVRVSDTEYRLEHKRILIDYNDSTFPFELKSDDGSTVPDFTLNIDTGELEFDNNVRFDVGLSASYTYDGIEMWDFDTPEDGKTYFGPEAKDTSRPLAPANARLVPDYENNQVRVVWDSVDATGLTYYYRVRAFENESLYSRLSDYRSVTILEELADRPYLVEKSVDGVVWKETARVKYTEFIDFLMDINPPNPVRNLTAATSRRVEDTLVNVTLRWINPAIALAADSPMYRVRAVNRIGYQSEPSTPVGPIPFDTPVKEIIVRIKKWDGVAPSYDGADAATHVTVAGDMNEVEMILNGNTKYHIALYVVDYGNNYSVPTLIEVTTPNNEKPIIPTVLSVTEFSTMVN